MKILLFLLRESWWQVIFAIATGFISGACGARLVSLINQSISQPNRSQLLAQFLGLALLMLVSAPTSQYLLIHLSQDSIYRLRLRLSRQLLDIPLRKIEEQGTHRLLPALTGDITNISNSIFIVPFICVDLAIILGCLIYLSYLSRPVFLFTLTIMVFGVLVSQALMISSRNSMRLARREQDRLFKHLRALIEGGKEFRLNHRRREEYLNNYLAITADSSRRHTKHSRTNFAITAAWGNFLFLGLIGLLIFAAPRLLNFEPLVLSGFVLTITYLMAPFQSLTQKIPSFMEITVSLKKLEQVGLQLDSELRNLPQQKQGHLQPEKLSSLELIDVTYHYSDLNKQSEEKFTIGPINLSFSPGEIVFIVGGNGSGKSTLAKVITGLYYPSHGKILLDSQEIEITDQAWYRQHFSTVFSDFYLFENLIGHDPSQIDERARAFLKELRLDHKVEVINGHLSTVELSQGQRKRLALLSAYLDDRPIYLFDEWAADQDPGFRALFYEDILPRLRDRGKLVLVISHDDGYFHAADRIVKLDYGRIVSVA